MAKQTINLSSIHFGRLLVIKQTKNKSGHGNYWLCHCKCGKTTIVRTDHLINGCTKSCGCWRTDNAARQFLKHGMKNTVEYKAWSKAKSRCLNKNDRAYKNYGGRGIQMSKEWSNSFEQFYRDMGPRPPNMELDRINNEGNYENGNCRWTTRITNVRNRRSTIHITHEGKTRTLKEWSVHFGISYGTLIARLKQGTNPLFKPLRIKRSPY